MKNKVLVTGGAGFIGSHVADELVAAGRDVIVLDDLSGGFRENVNPKALFVKGSVTDAKLINAIFKRNKIEHVYHLAAYAAEGLSHFIRRFNYENNLIGSVNLINASVNHGVKCFVFTSSIAVYGRNQLPMREGLTPCPEDPYGIAKLAVEQDLEAAHRMFGLDYVIFRPHNVYGERQNIGDRYRNVLGIFMNEIMQGRKLTIFGDGRQTRSFSYIKDVAPLIAKAPAVKKAYNQVFNVGADKPYTVNALAKVICKEMGAKPELEHLPARNEVVHAYADHSKVERTFRYKARYDLPEGVARMAAWARMAGSRRSGAFSGIEVRRNMPPSWAAVAR